MPTFSFFLPDESATERLGAALAARLRPRDTVALEGGLGAGKTTLARALIRALGHTGPVKSPTYALVEVYVVSSLYLYHFDFYRFNDAAEFDEAGLGEYFRADALCLVEWPDKAAGYVPNADLGIVFRFTASDSQVTDGRLVEFVAFSERGRQCLNTLKSRYSPAAN